MYDDYKKPKQNRIKVSFDRKCESMLDNPAYTNVIIPNFRREMKWQEIQHEDIKEKSKIRYLKDRLSEEKEKRKNVEKERDILISSLDDMTHQAKRLESTVRQFEKENIELYEKLKIWNQELTNYSDKNKDIIRQLSELQIQKDKADKTAESYKNTIEEQIGIIRGKTKEIDDLKTTNKAYDISNKENFKNMSMVMEKMIHMSSERQQVKSEMDNIIQRRRSMKNLGPQTSLQCFNNAKPFPYNTPLRDGAGKLLNYQNQKSHNKPLSEKSYSDCFI